jgi:hypothetical protein
MVFVHEGFLEITTRAANSQERVGMLRGVPDVRVEWKACPRATGGKLFLTQVALLRCESQMFLVYAVEK